MKAHAALEWANGRVVLHAEAAIHLRLAPVVDPGDPKLDHALGFDQPLQQDMLAVVRIGLNERSVSFSRHEWRRSLWRMPRWLWQLLTGTALGARGVVYAQEK